jgi:arylformamidase
VTVDGSGWIDATVMLRHGLPHWPGDPPVVITRVAEIAQGHDANVSHLSMGAHSGTHMDSPLHFIDGALGLDDMPFTATVGEARVIEIHDPQQVTLDELRPHHVHPGERILFRTANSERCWSLDHFVEDFVHISEAAARHLAAAGVRTVGVDYLSVGGFHEDGTKIHRILLGAGIWIVEGLDLSAVRAGRYEMVCLPIKLLASDGAPARVLLRALS